MRSSTDIQADISSTEAEVVELEAKQGELDDTLSEIKSDYKNLLNAEKVQEKISNVRSHRETLAEAIKERYGILEKLNQELEKAESKEVRESRIKDCIKQAKKANKFNKKYIDLMESLDIELVEKIAEIDTAYSQLATAANSFFNSLEFLEPAAKRKHNDPSNDSELIQSVEAMLNTIEERGNVDTTTARSEQFNRPHYHRKTARSIETAEVSNFGHWIRKMLNTHRSRQQRKAS